MFLAWQHPCACRGDIELADALCPLWHPLCARRCLGCLITQAPLAGLAGGGDRPTQSTQGVVQFHHRQPPHTSIPISRSAQRHPLLSLCLRPFLRACTPSSYPHPLRHLSCRATHPDSRQLLGHTAPTHRSLEQQHPLPSSLAFVHWPRFQPGQYTHHLCTTWTLPFTATPR